MDEGQSIQRIQKWIEKFGILPSFLIALVAGVIRNVKIISFGTIDLSKMPEAVQKFVEGVSGIGLTFGLELMKDAAGGVWYHTRLQRIELQFDTTMTAGERGAAIRQMKMKETINLVICGLAWAFSLAVGFTYATSLTGDSIGTAAADVAILLFCQIMTFYYGVLYEAVSISERARTLRHMQAQKQQMLDAIFDRLKAGTATPADIRFIQAELPASERARFAAFLPAPDKQVTYITIAQAAELIGRPDGAGRKYVERALAPFLGQDGSGVVPKAKGRGMQLDRAMLTRYFWDEIHALLQNTLIPQSMTSTPGSKPPDTPMDRQASDTIQTLDAENLGAVLPE